MPINNFFNDIGSNCIFDIQVLYSNSEAMDITSANIEGRLKKSITSTDLVYFDITKYDSSNGKFYAELDADVTETLDSDTYLYEFILTTSNGFISKILKGQLRFDVDIWGTDGNYN